MEKILCTFFLCCMAMAFGRNVLRVKNDDFRLEQDIDDNDHDVITGSYSWVAPNGQQFFIHYIADENGFRVLDSNAIPTNLAGVRADGSQGSFLQNNSDEDDDFDSFDDK